MFQQFRLHYQTGPYISAPHAYEAEMVCVKRSDGLAVTCRQTYTDREHLDQKDIEAEGFTTNDDFAWEGVLPKVWLRIVEDRFRNIRFSTQPSHHLYLEIDAGLETKKGAPEPENEWITTTEQLIQACLEAGEKELPMELVMGKLEKNNFYERGRLVWSFAQRSLSAQVLNGRTRQFSEEEWLSSQQNLRKWIEVEAQHADLYQVPTYKGLFWLLNGEVWLPYGGGAEIAAIQWLEDQLGM